MSKFQKDVLTALVVVLLIVVCYPTMTTTYYVAYNFTQEWSMLRELWDYLVNYEYQEGL